MNPDNSSNRHRQDAIGTPQVMKDGAEREGERERERRERLYPFRNVNQATRVKIGGGGGEAKMVEPVYPKE